MSDALATALEAARSRLSFGVEEAEAELVRARARARELRDSLTLAREFAGIGAGIQGAASAASPPRATAKVDVLVDLSNLIELAEPLVLSVRRRAALEGLRRADVRQMRASFSPNVVLRWDGDSPFAGMYLGRKQALALLELVLGQVDPSVDPSAKVRTEGPTLRVDARPALRGGAVRLPVTAVIRFDERERISQLFLTPEEGEALDHLLEAVVAEGDAG